jgi:hypothetical protein
MWEIVVGIFVFFFFFFFYNCVLNTRHKQSKYLRHGEADPPHAA